MEKGNKSTLKVRLKSYDHKTLELGVQKILEVANKQQLKVVGPIPLPTDKQVFTILRAVHKYKDAREQFEIRTHKRCLLIENVNNIFISELKRVDLPSGVDIDVKLTNGR